MASNHEIRYFFEHKLLPKWFFDEQMNFTISLLQDSSILYKAINDIYTGEGVENPYTSDMFKTEGGRISEDVFLLKITFPEPEEQPLCYCQYLFFDEKFEKVSFFTIERGIRIETGETVPFVCSWEADETHNNHGICTFEENDDFLHCADIHMEKNYGLKRN